jgi:hypothetical protein
VDEVVDLIGKRGYEYKGGGWEISQGKVLTPLAKDVADKSNK